MSIRVPAVLTLALIVAAARLGETETTDDDKDCAVLSTARQYESMGALEKAEERFSEARRCKLSESRAEALRALARVRATRQLGALRLAKTLESRGDWADALLRYSALATDTDEYVSAQAVEGVRRSRENLERERWISFEWWGSLGTRAAAL